MNVAVIGAGKMGLPLATVFASRGATVTACDINATLVQAVLAGRCPFDEPGVQELLGPAVASGQLTATTDTANAVSGADVVIVIVPVMLTEHDEADLTIIRGITATIGANLRRGAMICYETTLPVGTTRRLGEQIAKHGPQPGSDFDLVFSPERVKSQLVMKHLTTIPKVVGGLTPESARRAEEFYGTYLGAPVINVQSLEAAEFVKLAGMVYRDVNIALANELAAYAELLGTDFGPVHAAANTDGEANLLTPGIGVGGHCTPVYPHFLIKDAIARGTNVRIPEQARRINLEQPERLIERLGDVRGRRVTILGLSFRPEVKETAYSPAFDLQRELVSRGANVFGHDPLYSSDEIERLGFSPGDVEGSEILVLNTAHRPYHEIDFKQLHARGLRVVVDGRCIWNPEAVRACGIRYVGVGRPEISEPTTLEARA